MKRVAIALLVQPAGDGFTTLVMPVAGLQA